MKKIIPIAAMIIIIGGAGFFGGTKYGQSKISNRGFANFENMTPEQRQQRMQETSGANVMRFNGDRTGGGIANGEIIAKDDESITIKMSGGSSKIVFYSSSTQIGKFTDGSSLDLELNKTVIVSGTANSDGSITAQSIQLRPDGMPGQENDFQN